MELIDEELEKRFEAVGKQSEVENPLVIAKFFDPMGSATWYAIRYNPETRICYGYVTGMAANEWGPFSIGELESLRNRYLKIIIGSRTYVPNEGLGIERDINFKEIHFDDLMKELERTAELEEFKKAQDIDQQLE